MAPEGKLGVPWEDLTSLFRHIIYLGDIAGYTLPLTNAHSKKCLYPVCVLLTLTHITCTTCDNLPHHACQVKAESKAGTSHIRVILRCYQCNDWLHQGRKSASTRENLINNDDSNASDDDDDDDDDDNIKNENDNDKSSSKEKSENGDEEEDDKEEVRDNEDKDKSGNKVEDVNDTSDDSNTSDDKSSKAGSNDLSSILPKSS